jgi:hypothetical protein
VPTFGPGVVFDVDYSVRMEQFRFFTEALTVKRLKSYVDFMVEEAEVCCCCTAKSSFKVFATADEVKHVKKEKEKENPELDLFPLLQRACIFIKADLISFQLVGETS